MKQNLFRVIINEDKKRKLNVFVDNAAHVGGLLCGVLVMLIMIKGVNRKRGDNF